MTIYWTIYFTMTLTIILKELIQIRYLNYETDLANREMGCFYQKDGRVKTDKLIEEVGWFRVYTDFLVPIWLIFGVFSPLVAFHFVFIATWLITNNLYASIYGPMTTKVGREIRFLFGVIRITYPAIILVVVFLFDYLKFG